MAARYLLLVMIGLLCVSSCSEGDRVESEPSERGEQVSPMAASYLQGALRMAQRQDYAGALEAVERAKQLSPNAPDVYMIEGQVNLAAKNFVAARAALERAIALDPSEARSWEMLGHAAFQSRNFRDALDFYKAAAEREASPFIWQGIGSAYRELYQPDSARWAYRQVLELDDSFAPAWAALAEIEEDEGRYTEALAFAERASRAAPRAVAYQYMRARLLVRLDRADAAIPILEEIVHNDPAHYGALYNLGLAYQQVGRHMEAETVLQRAATARSEARERKEP